VVGTLNKAILIGYLGADPEIRDTLEGAVVTFNLATSFKPSNGNGQERTEWHRIVAWDKLAVVANDYLRKGSQTYVEGRIVTREWSDKQGLKRRSTEIVASRIILLGKRPDSTADADFQSQDDGPGGATESSTDDVPF